jgi:large subunit ribosomal protein L24
MKIKKNDQILIISGKDKGKKSKVIEVFPKTGKIVAEGVNIKKKRVKPKKSGEKGQTIEIPAPFDVSNIKIICKNCSKAVRVGYKIEEGKKYRICKKCGGTL